MKQPKVNIPQTPSSANENCVSGRFSKAYNDLMESGLHPRLVFLYGRLEFHAGKNGHCHPRHVTLAKEIGVKHRYRVVRLLSQLHELKLIEWIRRGPHANQYRILAPDINRIKDVLKRAHLDVLSRAHRKESSSGKRENYSSGVLTGPTPAPEKPKNFEKPDDERKPLGALTPEQEFRRRLAARDHGPLFDADYCLACVRKQLEKLGIELAEFLVYDQANTTGHGKSFKNPVGYYVGLAKDYVQATRDRSVKAMVAAAAAGVAPAPDIPRNGHGRCITCDGAGAFKGGGFCGCPLGQDLERVSRRGPKGESNGYIPRLRQNSG